MTPLVLPHPPRPLAIAWRAPLLTTLLSRLAGRAAVWPVRLEDWQLRDLDITRPFPGPGRPTHYDLP